LDPNFEYSFKFPTNQVSHVLVPINTQEFQKMSDNTKGYWIIAKKLLMHVINTSKPEPVKILIDPNAVGFSSFP
jgi:hypothetical protein